MAVLPAAQGEGVWGAVSFLRTMQLKMGSAVVSTAPVGVPPTSWQHSPGAPNGEWNLPHPLFGETPNRATGTVALPFSDCIFPAGKSVRGCLCVWRKGRLLLQHAQMKSSQLLSRCLEPLMCFVFLLFVVRPNGSAPPTLLPNGSFEEGQTTPTGCASARGVSGRAAKRITANAI